MSLVSLRQQQGNGRTSSAQSASLQVLISFFLSFQVSATETTTYNTLCMPCNPCCEQVPAMASYIAEAESSASCCDFCTIYCCFDLTLFALCLMSLPPFALASIQQKKITMVYARYGTSCPTAVLTTHSLPPIKRRGPGGPCRFSSYRS